MTSAVILCNCNETTDALEWYFKSVLGIKQINKDSLNNPYERTEIFKKTMESDLLVVDGFFDGDPKGFQLAKAMEKRTMVLFYAGEIDIEKEGPFWLVLPNALNRLGDKIKEIMAKPAAWREEYETLEERFPELREKKGHHH